VFILKGFKSCVLEVRILKELRAHLMEVFILRNLVASKLRDRAGADEVNEEKGNAGRLSCAEGSTPTPVILEKEAASD
jgi:hypothetical protein